MYVMKHLELENEISKIVKYDFLENEKSFWKEMKDIFPSFTSALFYTLKETSKNLAVTTF